MIPQISIPFWKVIEFQKRSTFVELAESPPYLGEDFSSKTLTQLTWDTPPSSWSEAVIRAVFALYWACSLKTLDCICPEEFTPGCPVPKGWRGAQHPSELLLRFLYFEKKTPKPTLSQTFWKSEALLTTCNFNFTFFLCAGKRSIRCHSHPGLSLLSKLSGFP